MDSGKGFIVHEHGWACSNDVMLDVQNELPEDGDIKKMKNISILKFNAIFEGQGELAVNQIVYCLFKTDGDDNAFRGVISDINNRVTVRIEQRSTKKDSIIQKIKGGKLNEQLLFR